MSIKSVQIEPKTSQKKIVKNLKNTTIPELVKLILANPDSPENFLFSPFDNSTSLSDEEKLCLAKKHVMRLIIIPTNDKNLLISSNKKPYTISKSYIEAIEIIAENTILEGIEFQQNLRNYMRRKNLLLNSGYKLREEEKPELLSPRDKRVYDLAVFLAVQNCFKLSEQIGKLINNEKLIQKFYDDLKDEKRVRKVNETPLEVTDKKLHLENFLYNK
jgi:hypothetical protein